MCKKFFYPFFLNFRMNFMKNVIFCYLIQGIQLFKLKPLALNRISNLLLRSNRTKYTSLGGQHYIESSGSFAWIGQRFSNTHVNLKYQVMSRCTQHAPRHRWHTNDFHCLMLEKGVSTWICDYFLFFNA